RYQADAVVVVAFGQILPKEILELTPFGCINVHASLLPKYRGAAPIQWSIIEGEAVTGVTTMQMDAGLDTGDMIKKTTVPIEAKETGGSLHDKLALEGAKLCVETLQSLEHKTAVWEKQEETTTPYAKMLKKEMGNIDWSQDAISIERMIRGLNPWPSAYTNWNHKIMKIWEAEVDNELELFQNAPIGTIVKVEKDAFYVQTGYGLLKIIELQLSGKKRMDAGAFLRGYQVKEGERVCI
ncbi:MAG: methionyl-tRNA formyltransferase, partial [Lachnospiraceae bacterium]